MLWIHRNRRRAKSSFKGKDKDEDRESAQTVQPFPNYQTQDLCCAFWRWRLILLRDAEKQDIAARIYRQEQISLE